MSELKHCPFCGGEAGVVHERRWISGVSKGYAWKYIACKKCSCRTMGYDWDDEKDMVEAWNRRVGA